MTSHNCKICNDDKFIKVNFNNLYLRTDSANKNLHDFTQRVCFNCGVVFQFPQIEKNKSTSYYETVSRITKHPIYLDENERIDFPIQFEQTGISFQRFHHFHKIIKKYSEKFSDLKLNSDTTILDYGAYQGAFLHACQRKWGVKTIAYDYNENGLRHAKNFLNINSVVKSNDICSDVFDEEINFCTALQVLEHLYNPLDFLKHVKNNVLKKKGYIYIEVPCALTSEFNNPVHLFMFTKESLKNLFEIAGYEIVHISEENIYNYEQLTPFKRHVQTMVHCLARAEGEEVVNKNFNIGRKTINNLKKSHRKNSNKIYFIRVKKLLKEIIILLFYGFFILIGFLSNKGSFALFNKIRKLLVKIPLLNKLSRK